MVGQTPGARPAELFHGDWERTGSLIPMHVTVDSVGRVVLPKALRERLGLVPGSTIDVSMYGDGLHLAPAGRTARLEDRDGVLVAVSETVVTDDVIFELMDSVRR